MEHINMEVPETEEQRKADDSSPKIPDHSEEEQKYKDEPVSNANDEPLNEGEPKKINLNQTMLLMLLDLLILLKILGLLRPPQIFLLLQKS